MDVEIDFTIKTVRAPEVTDDDGYAYYWISGAPRKGTNDTAKNVRQYAIKVEMDSTNKALWKASLDGRSKTSASQVFTLTSKGATADVTAVPLKANSTHTATSDEQAAGHAIVINFVASTSTLSVTTINGVDATSKTVGDDANYVWAETGSLFALRPHTELGAEDFPVGSTYESATAKYFTITAGAVTELPA